jgi:hypothetical protein
LIIDGTECQIEKPHHNQSYWYSGRKKKFSIKYEVAVHPQRQDKFFGLEVELVGVCMILQCLEKVAYFDIFEMMSTFWEILDIFDSLKLSHL